MAHTYRALRTQAIDRLLKDWDADTPTPLYYQYPSRLSPHPFMGLGKFVAGSIQQMRLAKSYVAAHLSWFDEDHDLTCPRCGTY